MIADISLVLTYLIVSLVCILGSTLFRKTEADISYDYLILSLYDADLEADAVKSEAFSMTELSDLSGIGGTIFVLLLVSNLWGLVDAHTLSLLATVILSMSWLLLRFIDVLLLGSYS